MQPELVGLATRPKELEKLEKDVRSLIRLIGPRVSAAMDDTMQFRHCTICTPPPEVFTCVICGFATTERWVYSMHIKTRSGPCQKMAEKKAREWAKKA